MPTLPQDETLDDLKDRHCALITASTNFLHPLLAFQTRLLNQLASVQIDLLRFHGDDAQAMLLNTQLARLASTPPTQDELLRRLLALLCPAA